MKTRGWELFKNSKRILFGLWIFGFLGMLICKLCLISPWFGGSDTGRDLLVSKLINEENLVLRVGHWMQGINFHYPPLYYNILAFTQKIFGLNSLSLLKFWSVTIFLSFGAILFLAKKAFRLDFFQWWCCLILIFIPSIYRLEMQAFSVAWAFFNIGFLVLELVITKNEGNKKQYWGLSLAAFLIAISCSIHISFLSLIPIVCLIVFKKISSKKMVWFLVSFGLFLILILSDFIRYFGGFEIVWKMIGERIGNQGMGNSWDALKNIWINFFGGTLISVLVLVGILIGLNIYSLMAILLTIFVAVIFALFLNQGFLGYYFSPLLFFGLAISVMTYRPKVNVVRKIYFSLLTIMIIANVFFSRNIINFWSRSGDEYSYFLNLASYSKSNLPKLPVVFVDASDFASIGADSRNLWYFCYDNGLYTISNDSSDFWYKDEESRFIFLCKETEDNKCISLYKNMDWGFNTVEVEGSKTLIASPKITIRELMTKKVAGVSFY